MRDTIINLVKKKVIFVLKLETFLRLLKKSVKDEVSATNGLKNIMFMISGISQPSSALAASITMLDWRENF